MNTCPDCDAPIITADTGIHLNPKRSRFGRYWADGTTATAQNIRDGIPTYFQHQCATNHKPTTTATANQASLF